MSFPAKYENVLVTVLRITLAIIFIWFGVLKILGHNPVYDLVLHSMAPFLAEGLGLVVLGSVEAFIGVMLLGNMWPRFTCTLLTLHLLSTFSTFIFGWDLVFHPYFPIFTLAGEFVVKNLILVISGLIVLVHESRKS